MVDDLWRASLQVSWRGHGRLCVRCPSASLRIVHLPLPDYRLAQLELDVRSLSMTVKMGLIDAAMRAPKVGLI